MPGEPSPKFYERSRWATSTPHPIGFILTHPPGWFGARAISRGWIPISLPAPHAKGIRLKSRRSGSDCWINSIGWALRRDQETWGARAKQARESLLKYFWLPEKGWFADVLLAPYLDSAAKAVPDDALRSNCVIPIMFDLVPKEHARRCLQNILRYLVIPGALRSLAPLPVSTPLPIHGSDWRLLNDPPNPYLGPLRGR